MTSATNPSRYPAIFEKLSSSQHGAFVPFVTLCDPSFDQSFKIIKCLVENGADALELGFPFSDPIADGPVIQAASIRALQAGSSNQKCFDLIAKVRQAYPDIPIGLLLYSNLVLATGIDQFYQKAQQAGVDSILIADVPIIESKPFCQVAEKYNIAPIFIATPNASEKTLQQVAQKGKGYTYLLSRAGTTGTEVKAEMPVDNILKKLKQYDAPPPLLGFGISDVEQVKKAINLGVAGVISGSAVVKIIQNNLTDEDKMLKELSQFIAQMKQATRV